MSALKNWIATDNYLEKLIERAPTGEVGEMVPFLYYGSRFYSRVFGCGLFIYRVDKKGDKKSLVAVRIL